MSFEEKKRFLELYLIQEPKILRLGELMDANPLSAARYARQIRKSRKLKRQIEKAIDAVDGGILTEVLGQKYLCGKSLEETAEILNYSKRQIERFHVSAIEKLAVPCPLEILHRQ